MSRSSNITASIVVYKENYESLQNTIQSFLKSPLADTLFIVDNSPTDTLRNDLKDPKIQYIFSGKNVGFGKGHNKVLELLKNRSEDFHLVLNPDVRFQSDILNELTNQLSDQPQCSFVSPKILYPDGKLQFTARMFPKFSEQLFRFLGVFSASTQNREYRNRDLEKAFYPEFIHGNFMLFRSQDFIKLNGFDERFFMYMEDADICKRIGSEGRKVLYYPKVNAIHEFRKGSSRNLKLFFVHLSSLIKYYKKWGF